jgi:hypothetical protein
MTGDDADGDRRVKPPARALDVAPTRLQASGGGRRRGIVALAAIAAVIGGAVGLAQLATPDRPAHRTVLAPTSAVAATPATTAVPPTTMPRVLRVPTTLAIPARVRPADLAGAVHDGSLDGRLVFVDGSMEVTPVRCGSLKEGWHGCVDLAVAGLNVPLWTGDSVRPWPGDPPAGAWLVTVARTGGLVYLGALLPDPERVAGITALEAKLDTRGHPDTGPADLFEVEGSLVPLPRRSCPEGCQAASPILVDKLASVSELMSTSGISVEVDAGTPEVDVDAAVVQGTFLVARAADRDGWRIVARYDPAQSFRVLAP